MANQATTAHPLSFAGHETFPPRYTWLPKAVAFVTTDPSGFSREDAMVKLGVGKNMVRSIRHWGLACGVLEEDPNIPNNRGRSLRPTTLGSRLLGAGGWDPYLEDPATLWVLHFHLAGTPGRASTWYFVFNQLPQPEFSKRELESWLVKLAEENDCARVSPASLRRDVDVFVRTYVAGRATRTVPLEDTLDSPFVELGLIRSLDATQTYVLHRGNPPTLPDAVFAYGLVNFLASAEATSQARAVPLRTLAFAPGSPGRVFALTEDALLTKLERIERITKGAVVFHDTAGLKQLLVNRLPDPLSLLDAWYSRPASRRASA